jgi:hypothetical protein
MVFRLLWLLSPEGAVSEGTGAKRDGALVRTKSVKEALLIDRRKISNEFRGG